MGQGAKSNLVYLVDFALAKRYKDATTNKHIRCTTKNGLKGTPRYKSLNAHNGREQSRRDDLEAIGYVLLYFLRAQLPWQGIEGQKGIAKKQKLVRLTLDSFTNPDKLAQLCKIVTEKHTRT